MSFNMPEQSKDFYIWNGIYHSFDEAEGELTVFDGDIWQNNLEKRLKSDLQSFYEPTSITKNTITHEYHLSTLVALLSEKKSSIRILDIGGGLASAYLNLLKSCPKAQHTKYHIVETEETCNHAQSLLNEFKQLYFHTQLPKSENFDVIHIGSTLQYIKDWKGLIHHCIQFKPKYILLSDLMAGDIPTFVSTQFFYGKKIPTWFWNINDILSFFNSIQCELLLKSLYMGKFFQKNMPLPMDNFPKTHQLSHACHLLFSTGYL